jgi:hypothetical protein
MMNYHAGKNMIYKKVEALKSMVSHRMGWKNKEKIKLLFKVNLIRSVDESRRDILQF